MPADEGRTLELLDKLGARFANDDARAQNYLDALRQQLQTEGKDKEEQVKLLAEYEEAYNKLTAPANRIGTFMEWLSEPESANGEPRTDDLLALISLGDSEYVSQVDPKVDFDRLAAGVRVKVNEAFAVVGVLPPAPNGGLIKVGEVLDGDRLRVGDETPGSQGRIVLRGDSVKDTKINAGDEVRLDPSGKLALEHRERQESRDYFLEDVPELPWDKVGGQTEAISLIRDTIEQPLLYPEIFERFEQKPVKGILLYGPPGNGKTLIGKATAYNLTKEYQEKTGKPVKEYFMSISGPKILNMWLGETERMVREIFKTARVKAKEGCLVFIFMDEAESVLRTRSSGRYLNISNTVVPQFCAELDGMQALENVVLILTSNRPDFIDPAVLRPGRIDRKVKVNRPDRATAEAILGIYLHNGIPLDPELVKKWDGEPDCARKELIEATTEYIWRKERNTEFLKVALRNGSTETLYRKDLVSGALLKSIIDRAKETAIRRAIEAPDHIAGVAKDDLLGATDREFKENEIFPKSDNLEDWLQLLDQNPEQVVTVKPIGLNRGEELSRKAIV
ncbi:proteasome ATPase [soil metagenome]